MAVQKSEAQPRPGGLAGDGERFHADLLDESGSLLAPGLAMERSQGKPSEAPRHVIDHMGAEYRDTGLLPVPSTRCHERAPGPDGLVLLLGGAIERWRLASGPAPGEGTRPQMEHQERPEAEGTSRVLP